MCANVNAFEDVLENEVDPIGSFIILFCDSILDVLNNRVPCLWERECQQDDNDEENYCQYDPEDKKKN